MKAETTKILIPRTLFETGADKDIELEGTLADYLPGINRVVRTEANVYIDDAAIKGSKAEVRGKAVFSMLYESDYKGKLRCERFSTDFTHLFDLGEIPEGECLALAAGRCSYVGCKTLNPRRFILKCRADLSLEVRCMQSRSVVSREDLKGAYFKTERHSLSVFAPPAEKSFSLRETVTLDGMPPVGEIIYSSLELTPTEHRAEAGSVIIHGTAALRCLYEEEGDESALRYTERSFPLSFTVEGDSIADGTETRIALICTDCEVTKEMDGYGEMRVLTVNATVKARAEAAATKEIELPVDLFFEEYDSKWKADILVAENRQKGVTHRFSMDKLIEIPELAFNSIVETNAEIWISEVSAEADGVYAKGSCALSILGKGEEGLKAHDVSLSFKEKLPINREGDGRIKARGRISSAAAELRGDGRVGLRVSAEIETEEINKLKMTAITSAEIKPLESKEEDDKPLVIYYPDHGETAWDIGKRYHKDPRTVISENPDVFDKAEAVKAKGCVLYM